jgi:hypothetical protein
MLSQNLWYVQCTYLIQLKPLNVITLEPNCINQMIITDKNKKVNWDPFNFILEPIGIIFYCTCIE